MGRTGFPQISDSLMSIDARPLDAIMLNAIRYRTTLTGVAPGLWEKDVRWLLRYIERSAAPLEALDEIWRHHWPCGPKYEGCYSHWPTPHCRADGMAWPCDAADIRSVLLAKGTHG